MTLTPVPDGTIPRTRSVGLRQDAASSAPRPVVQRDNGEAKAIAAAKPDAFVAAHGTFTKGRPHDFFGRVRAGDVADLLDAADRACAPATPAGKAPFPGIYDGRTARLDAMSYPGPPAEAVALPPAPALGSPELTAEMAELYGAALLRDVPFATWNADPKVAALAGAIADLPYFRMSQIGDAAKRRAARGPITPATLLRGCTHGGAHGPYVSQFMLVGNGDRTPRRSGTGTAAVPRPDRFVDAGIAQATTGAEWIEPRDGFVVYGAQTISQRLVPHLARHDHMTDWDTWLGVQDGATDRVGPNRFEGDARFIATPRDLASYVHFDIPCQAYLTACLILLGAGEPLDVGLPDSAASRTGDPFSAFGARTVLALVSEVATRAQDAARRQGSDVHLRAHPEAVAAGIALAWAGDPGGSLGTQRAALGGMCADLGAILPQVAAHNRMQNAFRRADHGLGPLSPGTNALLPMAYPEGAPMAPSYAAGHAAIAGACVTIIKAVFEMFAVEAPRGGFRPIPKTGRAAFPRALFGSERMLSGTGAMLPSPYEADPEDPRHLRPVPKAQVSTQGELDKLAANMSLGRCFAGVSAPGDCFESLRLGERIAVALLRDHVSTCADPVSLRFTSFDGDRVLIAGTDGPDGRRDGRILVWDRTGAGGGGDDLRAWWTRHA